MKQSGLNTLARIGESAGSARTQQRISFLAMTLLLVIAAWILGRLAWQPWSEETPSKWKPTNVAGVVVNASELNIAELQSSHLFGRLEQKAAPVVEKPKLQDAPKSKLNVVLVGVVTSSNETKSLAVIANRGKQATYGIGETIDGTRAKLVQVQSDRAIIDNSGRNETIMLEGLKYSKPTQTSSRSKSSSSAKKVSSSEIDRIRTTISNDPKQIFQYVRMSQVKENGSVKGYRLSPGKEKALFQAVGLESGDIAIQINGLDLRDASVMQKIYGSMSQMTELNLTVERDGQQHEIYIEL